MIPKKVMNVYQNKAQSYINLKGWITKHKKYSETNEWACHELVALFYEVVMISKSLLERKNLYHRGHQIITESLERINPQLSDAYQMLYSISKKLRYEAMRVSRKDRNDFLLIYSKFKKLAQDL